MKTPLFKQEANNGLEVKTNNNTSEEETDTGETLRKS
jgi:hypothetical protein